MLFGEQNREVVWKTKKERKRCAFLIHHEGKRGNAPVIIEALRPGDDLVNCTDTDSDSRLTATR